MGSAKYIHEGCLNHWRAQDPDGVNFRRCNVCHFEYHLVGDVDPTVERARKKAWAQAVAIDVWWVVLWIVGVILITMLILYMGESTGLIKVQATMYRWLRISNTWLAFFVAAVGLLLIVAGVVTLFRDEEAMSHLNVGTVGMVGLHPPLLLGASLGLGVGSMTYHMCRHIDESRRKHRQRIWLHQEAALRRAHDFGEAGPPPE